MISSIRPIIRPMFRSMIGSGGTTLWTPANRTTDLWLQVGDLSTITFDGTDPNIIDEWADKSGNTNDVKQTTTGRKPDIEVVNGVNGIFMDGINDRLDADTYQPFGELTIYIVASNGTTSNEGVNVLVTTSVTGGDIRPGFAIYNGSDFLVGPDQRSIQIEGQLTTTSSDYTNGTPGNASIPQDQAAIFATVFECVTASPNTFRIGSYADGVFYGDAIVFEIIVVVGNDSDADRERMEGYLAWEYEALGLVDDLPVSHPYKDAAPTI